MTELEQEINGIRKSLLQLHAQLLNSLREQYQIGQGSELNPFAWLQLITHDPAYVWIKPLNELIIDIDLLLETGEPRPADAATLRESIEDLFNFTLPPGSFADRYRIQMSGDPDLILRLQDLKALINHLPNLIASEPLQQRRLVWREQHQARRKKKH